MKLRRACCAPALQLIVPAPASRAALGFMELVEELVRGGHKALVFSQFMGCLSEACCLLDAAGYGYRYLDGSTPDRERQAAVAAFQSGDLFLISLKAGGGSTLPPPTMIHLTRGGTPPWRTSVRPSLPPPGSNARDRLPAGRAWDRGGVHPQAPPFQARPRRDVLEGTDVPERSRTGGSDPQR